MYIRPCLGILARSDNSRASQSYGSGYPGASAGVFLFPGRAFPMGMYLDILAIENSRSGFTAPTRQPGGGHLPSSPGNREVSSCDPRIGGLLCWLCGGRGKTCLLIFDETTCCICNGIGQTFASTALALADLRTHFNSDALMVSDHRCNVTSRAFTMGCTLSYTLLLM
ncbi:hypothetical protein C8Q74DRAFT_570807 [Fomes fomentarius]|nr:hypothetical protein C8Q74DRAFT_570807 [Fomes fomentarius]